MGGPGSWIFLSPGWLAAGLAALAIPLIIHLISRSRGRRVLMGSTRLVRTARRKLVYQLRMTQWLLFAVRALMLLVAALILGHLSSRGLDTFEGDVAYATPGWLTAAPPDERERISQSFESFFVLAPGFPPVATFRSFSDEEHYDLWPLLAERLSVVSHGGAVHIYSSGTLGEFGQLAPPLPRGVDWHVPDTPVPNNLSLPLHVAVVTDAGSEQQAGAVDQALQVIQKHRLPELQWTLHEPPDLDSPSRYDAVIIAAGWAAEVTVAGEPDGPLWIDLRSHNWRDSWTGADFPQRLLDALLNEDDLERAWSFARVPAAGASDTLVETERALQLPKKPLQPWLALAMIVLWGFERWLSERRAHAPV